MTGSHSRLGISDRESHTMGVIRAYDTGFFSTHKLTRAPRVSPTRVTWQLCNRHWYVRPRPEAHRSSERVFTYRERCRPHNRDQGCACFQEKYYLGYVLLEQLSIATDIQFQVFNFQICFPCIIYKKRAYSAHTMST